MQENTELSPFSPIKNKKVYAYMGLTVGLLTLGSGFYLSTRGVVSLYQVGLSALTIFCYLSIIPVLINTCFKCIRPLFIKFGRFCKKRKVDYELRTGFRSVNIVFDEGTKWGDRLKMSLLFELIYFLQVLLIITTFYGLLFAWVHLSNWEEWSSWLEPK